MLRRRRLAQGMVLLAGIAMVTTACGGSSSGGGGSSNKAVVIGTTDKVVSFDPAGSYDLGSWTPMYSMFQTLVHFQPGDTTPKPDAAKSCDFTDPTHYECTLRPNQKFWNGDVMTAQDVVFSFQRNVKIAAPQGAASLLDPMKSVAAQGKDKVVFTLKYPFTAFPGVLTDPGMAIVDHKVFPADKLMANDKVIGSGPYQMTKYEPDQQLVLKPSKNYGGPLKLKNSGVIVRYYSKPSALKLAIESGDADVAYRTFSPTDIAALRKESGRGVQVVEGQGAEIQYIVFNLKIMPGNNPQQKLAVRKAAAMSIDRAAIAKNVYNGTVKPLYSMVPDSLKGSVPSFKTLYGASPNVQKAKQTLAAAGVKTPVNLDLWWTPSHYGESSADMYTNIQRQLDATGLFKINLHSAEWDQYTGAYPTDQYQAFQLGWFPDYPDADDYVTPFFGKASFLKAHFSNPKVEQDIQAERAATDQSKRNAAFADIQKISAEQVPTIPIWQGKQIAVQRKGVTGVKQTLDASYTFRYWLIGKS
ncbi:MAG: ABC transporter substrate-binding protein [Sciscionella sp.]